MRTRAPAEYDVYDDFDAPADRRPAEDLRRVARYQRWVIAVVLAQLVLWAGVLAVNLFGRGLTFHPNGPLTITYVLGGVGGVYVFLLYREVRGSTPFALVFALATVIPVLGLLILTMTNGYATSELRAHGVPVGLFGAGNDDVPDEPSLYDIDEETGW